MDYNYTPELEKIQLLLEHNKNYKLQTTVDYNILALNEIVIDKINEIIKKVNILIDMKNKEDCTMRKCECTFWDNETKCMVTMEGLFHCWGMNYMAFSAGPGNYTVGIVELPGGRIIECDPKNIRFLEETSHDERI